MKMKTYNSMTDFLNSLDNSKITGEIQAAFVKAWNKIHGYGGNSEMELSTMYPKIMVSVSGGSDSDIVLDLVERIGYPLSEVHYAFFDTGLEFAAALAKNNPHAWKSKRHDDGSVPFGGGWFIMGFDTDEGCYTYHYELKDWDLFQCKELEKGKPWDGHTSKDVRRLLSIPAADVAPVVHGRWRALRKYDARRTYRCSVCGRTIRLSLAIDINEYAPYCNCGARMDGDDDAKAD